MFNVFIRQKMQLTDQDLQNEHEAKKVSDWRGFSVYLPFYDQKNRIIITYNKIIIIQVLLTTFINQPCFSLQIFKINETFMLIETLKFLKHFTVAINQLPKNCFSVFFAN